MPGQKDMSQKVEVPYTDYGKIFFSEVKHVKHEKYGQLYLKDHLAALFVLKASEDGKN